MQLIALKNYYSKFSLQKFIKKRLGHNEINPPQDEQQMGLMSWTACDTAVDLLQGFDFRGSLRLALQSTARSNETHESATSILTTKKYELTTNNFDY
jgi:hypothetical protein